MRTSHAITAQAVRYALTGATVFGVYVGATLALSGLGMPIAAAIAVAYVLAVTLHFLMQRHFVFRREAFALSTGDQIRRYVVIGVAQYAVTASLTAVLPGWLGISEQVVYAGVALAISGGVFLFLRSRVFHH